MASESRAETSASQFGSRPYKGSLYGPAVGKESQGGTAGSSAVADEMERLQRLLTRLKAGDFGAVEELSHLLLSKDYDVRQYACQLYAHVCNHQQVGALKQSLIHAEDTYEIQRVIMRLGHTLSQRAIPIILEFRRDIGESEIDDHIYDAIELILGKSVRNVLDLEDQSVVEKYHDFAAQLDPSVCFYYGQPVFVGDVTKELIVAAMVSLKEHRGVILRYQPQLLSNFSGIPCPIHYGDVITEEVIQKVIDYVNVLSEGHWVKSRKYFYRHIIP
jgi:hypothetical protein